MLSSPSGPFALLLSTRKTKISPDNSIRTPKQFQWSPDGRTLTYILPREDGESRDLWAVTPATGDKRVLVSYQRLSQLAPSADKAAGDEREQERLLRYSVAAYRWSPDSQSILFTSGGQLYLYDVSAEKARPRRIPSIWRKTGSGSSS